MEFINGETVEERVKRLGPFSASAALALALQATRALTAAHRLNLIHRDIKPANLMLVREDEDEEGEVLKLIDFGLAKSVAAPGHDVSQRSLPVFTPAYASPEQCQELPVDIRADIYSLGYTLWFMLTGAAPFRGRSTFEVQSKQINAPPPLAELDAADVPGPVRDLLARMLEKEPADRPQNPGELRREIEACQSALTQETDGDEDAPPAPPPPYSFSLEDLLRQRGPIGMDGSSRPAFAPCRHC
jgi:serine/threonine protein kinase